IGRTLALRGRDRRGILHRSLGNHARKLGELGIGNPAVTAVGVGPTHTKTDAAAAARGMIFMVSLLRLLNTTDNIAAHFSAPSPMRKIDFRFAAGTQPRPGLEYWSPSRAQRLPVSATSLRLSLDEATPASSGVSGHLKSAFG